MITPANSHLFCVKPDDRNNVIKFNGNQKLIVDHRFRRTDYDVYTGTVMKIPNTVKLDRPNPTVKYRPTDNSRNETWKQEFIEWTVDIKEGDKIYFHHNAFEYAIDAGLAVNKPLGTSINWEQHEVDYFFLDVNMGMFESSIYCYERDGELFPAFDNCLAEFVYDEESTTPSGIILNPVQVQKPKMNYLKILKIGPCSTGWDFEDGDVNEGDIVYVHKNSPNKLKIDDDKDIVIITRDDVLGVLQ